MAKQKSNSFRNSSDDFQPEEKPAKKQASAGKFAWIKDERTTKIAGAFFVLFSLFLFLSFTSHIINLWGFETDQDLLQSQSWGWYKSNNPKGAANMMGYIGAWFGHLFIHKWFGIASFGILFSIFTFGTKLLFNWQMYPILKILRYTFFIVVWISLLMGFIFHKHNMFMGGGFGYFGFMWMKGLVGYIGTVLFLVLYAMMFMIIVYNVDFRFRMRSLVQDLPIEDDSMYPAVPFSEHELEAEKIKNEFMEREAEIIESPADHHGIHEVTLETPEPATHIAAEVLEEEPLAAPITFDIPLAKSKKPDISKTFELKIEAPVMEEVIEEPVAHIIESPRETRLDELYDPTLDLPGYQMPTIDLLQDYEFAKTEIDRSELESSKNLIIETLKNYNIGISEIKANIGPTVTLYEIVPAPGVKVSRIKNLEDDIALSLAALGIRIIAPIPGKGTIGIEVPNKKPEMVPMRQMVASKKFQECQFELPVILGKTISNELYIADLSKMPHLLCAGATGQGKSVGLNTLIVSLLYKKHPSELKFVLVDPKKVELTLYNKIERHFLAKLPGDGYQYAELTVHGDGRPL